MKNKWSDEQLQAAMDAVKSKRLSAASSACRYGIPASTLHDHLVGKSKRLYGGRGGLFTPIEEKEIERLCQVMQELGFPLTRDFVSVALRDYLIDTGRAGRFKDGIPTYDWWKGFFTRHPQLVERKPEHLPRNRAQASRPEVQKLFIFMCLQVGWL